MMRNIWQVQRSGPKATPNGWLQQGASNQGATGTPNQARAATGTLVPAAIIVALLIGAFLFATPQAQAQANSDPVGTPSVTGAARSGETLTADTSAIMDADGLGTFSYQWAYLDGTTEMDISGETGSTYPLSEDDVGKELIVKVSYTDGNSNNEEVTSPPSDPVETDDLVVLNKEEQTASYSLTSTTFKYAQAFTSDATAGSHILDSIGITFSYIGNTATAGDDITVTLNEAATSEPGGELCTLEDPASFTNSGKQVFRAPAATIGSRCPDLEPEKTYYVVIEKDQSSTDSISLTFSGAAAIHSGSAAGWTVSAIAQHYTTFFGSWADLATTGFMNLDVRSREPFALEPLTQTEVPSTWPLVPQGLTGGQKFRLMFLTSDERATSDDINVYNEFVQAQAAQGHTSIRDYASQFRVLGSTAGTDGQDNTRITSRNEQSPPVSIFWLGGPRIADSYHDLRGDRWSNEDDPRTTDGNTTAKRVVWTGSNERFRERTVSGSSAALGTASVGTGELDHATHGPALGATDDPTDTSLPLYALSGIFVIANTAATGQPTITGTPRAGEVLTADVTAITDPEGTADAVFRYQWYRFDGQNQTAIDSATGATYKLVEADADMRIIVEVSFQDDMGFPEGPLQSVETSTIVGRDVLVQNTGQAQHPSTSGVTEDAQSFTTGTNADGYILESIGILLDTISNPAETAGSELAATLNSETNGKPGTILCTLTDPTTFTGSGVQNFTAPQSGDNMPNTVSEHNLFLSAGKDRNKYNYKSPTRGPGTNTREAGKAGPYTKPAHFLQQGNWREEANPDSALMIRGQGPPCAAPDHFRPPYLGRQPHGESDASYENTGDYVIAPRLPAPATPPECTRSTRSTSTSPADNRRKTPYPSG